MDENIRKREKVFSGRLFDLWRYEIDVPGHDEPFERLVVQHPGAVAVVPIDDDGNVLLVRQYRLAAGRVLLEIPAGTLNPQEAPDVCAVRELREETGYQPGRLNAIGGVWVAPSYDSEYIHLFVAEDLTPAPLAADADEQIEVERVPLADAVALVERGEINDAKSVAGLLKVARMRGV